MPDAPTQTLRVELLAIARPPIEFDATQVVLPGSEGVLAILPDHAPLLSILTLGIIEVSVADGGTESFAINTGIAQIDGRGVRVLSQSIERGAGIDVLRLEATRERTRGRVEAVNHTQDIARAELALKRTLAQAQRAEHVFPPTADGTARGKPSGSA